MGGVEVGQGGGWSRGGTRRWEEWGSSGTRRWVE